jgi:chemotaxis protein CheD
MLPETKMAKEGANPAKFADTAIEAMLEGMIKLGAKYSRIEAKIIGGARMFSSASSNPLLDIGTRNVAAAKHALHRKRIRLVAEDTGEDYARCIEFSCFSGKVKVRSLKRGEKEL